MVSTQTRQESRPGQDREAACCVWSIPDKISTLKTNLTRTVKEQYVKDWMVERFSILTAQTKLLSSASIADDNDYFGEDYSDDDDACAF